MLNKPKTLEDWKEVGENHFELCELLHNSMSELPPIVKDKIWDVLYRHFEP